MEEQKRDGQPLQKKNKRKKNRMATSVDDGTHVQHANAKLRKTTSDRCSSTTLSIHIDVVFLLACNWSKWVSLWSLTTFFFSFTFIFSTVLGRTVSFCFFLPSFTGFSWFSSGLLRVLLGFTGLLLYFVEFYWVVLGFTGIYWVLLGLTGFYLICRVLLGYTRFYWVLLVFIGFYWVLLGFNGLYSVSLDFIGFHWAFTCFVEFYWVLLGFTGLYWVLLGFTGFY